MNFLLRGCLKEHVYAVFPRAIEDLVVRFQAAVTTADADMLGRVQENAVRVIALNWTEARFKHLL
jgi:hypothetical protein